MPQTHIDNPSQSGASQQEAGASNVPYKDLFNSSQQDVIARLQLLYSNAIGGYIVSMVCMAIFCFGFETPQTQYTKTWIFVLYTVVQLFRLADNVLARQSFTLGDAQPKRLVIRFSVGMLANGAVWALYSVLFVSTMESYQVTVSAVTLAALAGGTITILAATTLLSILYMSCLLLPFIVIGLFNPFEYFHYISLLGFIYWCVMVVSANKIGKFFTQVLQLKTENTEMLDLMHREQKEVKTVNKALTLANKKLDNYATRLESEVDERTQDLLRLSNIDPLTGLQNRTAFTKRMQKLFSAETIHGQQYLLLFIDLDGFKDVNDGFGHKIGDLVLEEIAKRLNSLRGFIHEESQTGSAENNDCLCRWGGDEFLFLSPFKTQSCVDNLVNAIQQRIQEPITLASNYITLGASIGISRYPYDSELASDLIQYADISMYHHKKQKSGKAVNFSVALFNAFQEDQTIRDGLKNALRYKEFSLVFHPIVDINDNSVWAFEALLRWQHRGKPISPAEFIPIAEKSGHIIQIGRWVLFTACQEAMLWRQARESIDLPSVSVNVSAVQLIEEDFFDLVKLALLQSGLPANRLHLEITESVMLEKTDIANQQLKKIADLGIHISIDDFGTGYSSLNQLQTMSFDIIKIDRSFLQTLNKKDLTIISATKLIADEFSASTVAEGIETEKELLTLQELGIRYIQGFYFSKPLASAQVIPWLETFPKVVSPEHA
jgi:diguanylate cyclase (GGDEF)-like protein